jgi:phosphoglycolate phosphatase
MKSRRPRGRELATFAPSRLDRLRDATTLLLFDIDGTLVLTGGAGARAMDRAFEELFGVPNGFGRTPMPGRTDSWILDATLAAHGIPKDDPRVPRFHDIYLRHLAPAVEEPSPRKGVMPGVRPLLDELSTRTDVYLALLTGNYEAAARVKLEHFDLWRYFRCGAFGDAAPERNGLLAKAIARVAACGGPVVAPKDAVIVGDTPLDVAVAVTGGARCIAVATGSSSAADLRAAGADVVFEDLSDTRGVIAAIDNWRKRLGVEPSLPA